MFPLEYEHSRIYAKNQKEYLPLPAITKINGDILITWKLSLKERIKLLFNGCLYHQVKTFNQPLQPILITVEKPQDWFIPSKYDSFPISNESKEGIKV